MVGYMAVSYTHLDVYKRQEQDQKDLTNSYIPSSLLKEDKFAGNDTFNQLLANQIYQKLQELQYVK